MDEKEITTKDEKTKKERFNSAFENEFFYLNFSKYSSLTTLKNLTHDKLFEFVEISNNFDEFKDDIINRGMNKDLFHF